MEKSDLNVATRGLQPAESGVLRLDGAETTNPRTNPPFSALTPSRFGFHLTALSRPPGSSTKLAPAHKVGVYTVPHHDDTTSKYTPNVPFTLNAPQKSPIPSPAKGCRMKVMSAFVTTTWPATTRSHRMGWVGTRQFQICETTTCFSSTT
eukprot:3452199-Amphidinium_carterae.1